MFELNTVVFAFSLTLLAGLATGIGGALAFFAKQTNTKFLSIALGFSAGVMIYVSFVEILFKGTDLLSNSLGTEYGNVIATVSFFTGIFIIAIIDKLVPSFENPHELHTIEEVDFAISDKHLKKKYKKLYGVGVFTAIAIAIHNFPEGLATFASALSDPTLGVAIAIAIAIHNIPEGIAVAVPIYYATGSRKKAFLFSFLSGLAEPFGALVGYLFLLHFFNDVVLGVLFAGVAGIMIFISLDELLPAAQKFGHHHASIYGLICGMIVMAVSLLLFM
ncbi:MAG: zinc transporter ZupT [Candidatus Nanoarchaeia archaeon]